MGYYSDVHVAITKKQYMQDNLLSSGLPKILREKEPKINNLGVYWEFINIKFYSQFPEVKELNGYLWELDNKEVNFALIIVGEDNVIKEEGDPNYFGLNVETKVTTPFN